MTFTIDWAQVVDWVFQIVLLPGLYMGIKSLNGMNKSIIELNRQVAILLTNHHNHEKRLDKLEKKQP